jgi:hypothetical protein
MTGLSEDGVSKQEPSVEEDHVAALVLGFGFLGLLIGNIAGMTSAAISSSLLSLLFAFVGGSILVFLEKLSPETRKLAGQSVAALSICCLVGIYSGIYVSEHRLLSPKDGVATASAAQKDGSGVRDSKYMYLRSMGAATEVDAGSWA